MQQFVLDDESVTLSNEQPNSAAPSERFGMIICLGLLGAVIWLLTNINSNTDLAVGLTFSLIVVACVLFSVATHLAKMAIEYDNSSIESKAIGILEKEHDPSSGYILLSFVDKENHRGTVKILKSQTGLVSVGDVGVIFLRAGRVIGFSRSSRF